MSIISTCLDFKRSGLTTTTASKESTELCNSSLHMTFRENYYTYSRVFFLSPVPQMTYPPSLVI
jgi:hypothetical protein